jgi:hypothetical protein
MYIPSRRKNSEVATLPGSAKNLVLKKADGMMRIEGAGNRS